MLHPASAARYRNFRVSASTAQNFDVPKLLRPVVFAECVVEGRRKVFVQLSRTGSTILETLSGTPRRTSSIESRPSSSAGESYFGWRNNAEPAERSIWLESGTWHFMDDEKSEVELDIEIFVALGSLQERIFRS
jgi:hypothetical protein